MSAKPTKDGTPQKRLNFDVPEELAKEFKAYAALQGKTQREIVIAFMQRCVRRTENDRNTRDHREAS
uniref:hypothetical protein n=1 Tax=Arthrobacter sp. TaxID=1667 RepID=UPI000EB66E02|nr:hypothetical protein [Arthrobacter sp.]AXV46378.1 hypothetical protein pA40H2_p21 [Arthrobacter sp.]